ncbi:MAG: flagellar hook-basal body protein [Hydrogenimonas sp.]|nr:flagellar hook-basal body protein [Hydrogenimonas sp.]
MQNGFYSVTGAMVTQFNRLDQISSNLANMNTGGYKRQDEIVGDYMRIYQQKRDELPLRNHTKEGAKFLNRSINRVPRIVEEYTDFAVGPMKSTGNPLDVALAQEDLFFAVETPGGVRLTRNGAFTLDENGRVVTKEGYPVLPAGYFGSRQTLHLPAEAMSIKIDESGRVEYMDQTAVDTPVYVDKLMVVRVDTRSLKREGDNLFTMENGVDEQELEVVSRTSAVRQGMLEMSNVNPVREMTALIETNRLVEMYQKAMNAQMDDLNNDAINKLASVRA